MKRIIFLCTAFFAAHTFTSHAQNLLDLSSWNIGSGSTGTFSRNGSDSENIREWGEGPDGVRTILWKAVPDAASNGDGGWNTGYFSIDHTKMYRFTVWIKKTNSNDGYTYLGCRVNPQSVLTLNGSSNSNPYFWVGDLPELNKWYLIVGYIHGSGDASTANYGGIYDGETGEKVISCTDFKFPTSATSAGHRSYLYYDVNTSDRQYFYAPRMEQVNGDEPPIETLGFRKNAFLNADNTSFDGNIGIGTNTPNAPLVVGSNFGAAISGSSGGHGMFGSNMAIYNEGANHNSYYTPYNHSNGYGYASMESSWGRLLFYTGGGNTTAGQVINPVPRMIIKQDGKVGIGTSNPQALLAVNGSVYAKEVKVMAAGWSDFVFEEDYPLPSLKDVEEYIDAEGHLPDIPSEAEVMEQGITLGAMDSKLLQKIEELTLYLIEQNKKINELVKKDQELERENRLLRQTINELK